MFPELTAEQVASVVNAINAFYGIKW
jgi:hypothetical protein